MSRHPLVRRPRVPALLALGLVALISAPLTVHAQSQKPVLTTIHHFDLAHGANPHSKLTLGSDGSFYGTTSNGGANGDGTLYSVTPDGHFKTLWSFNGKNGILPVASLAQGKDGAFYGTARGGGTFGNGTVFRITPQGRLTTLLAFDDVSGGVPTTGLTPAPDGSFYGVTLGTSTHTYGTVFHITTTGQVTFLYPFSQQTGYNVYGLLAFGADGALYGVTTQGGIHTSGTIFRLTTGGQFTLLHSFSGSDGRNFNGFHTGLTPAPDGTLYGIEPEGGSHDDGVVYKITPSGAFITLHKFSSDGHGLNPASSLTLGANGLLYGTTVDGGTGGRGTIFQMTPEGQLTTLYKFHTNFDGAFPIAGVAFGPDGSLYGPTNNGGPVGSGTIYKLSLPQ